jgi:hypothetical protein
MLSSLCIVNSVVENIILNNMRDGGHRREWNTEVGQEQKMFENQWPNLHSADDVVSTLLPMLALLLLRTP